MKPARVVLVVFALAACTTTAAAQTSSKATTNSTSKCPPVTPKNEQEKLMIEQSSAHQGCWVRDPQSGQLEFISSSAPDSNYKRPPLRAPSGPVLTGSNDCTPDLGTPSAARGAPGNSELAGIWEVSLGNWSQNGGVLRNGAPAVAIDGCRIASPDVTTTLEAWTRLPSGEYCQADLLTGEPGQCDRGSGATKVGPGIYKVPRVGEYGSPTEIHVAGETLRSLYGRVGEQFGLLGVGRRLSPQSFAAVAADPLSGYYDCLCTEFNPNGSVANEGKNKDRPTRISVFRLSDGSYSVGASYVQHATLGAGGELVGEQAQYTDYHPTYRLRATFEGGRMNLTLSEDLVDVWGPGQFVKEYECVGSRTTFKAPRQLLVTSTRAAERASRP